jgi:TonB-linked SusC/RagA family outer membrane protein
MKISVTQTLPKASTFSLRLFGKLFTAFFLTLIFVLPAHAQNITVRGRVLNETGQGVPNASVTVKGTTTGVSSNETGNFEISAPSNGTLVITSIGFAPKEVSVKGQTTLNITMGASGNDLEQVVVVGYGTQRRKDLTGSIVSVTEKSLDEVRSNNITQALQGRAAGVDIARTGVRPGSGGQIRIRGNRSLSASNDPLIVVDGMPYGGSINDLNIDDISNIDILKDASATAIYGSRGSNGVIIVTTKRGRVGKPVISYNTSFGISKPIDNYKVFNGPEFAAFKREAGYAFTANELAGETNGTNTDWQDVIYKDAHVMTHDLSLSGGTDLTQYGMGASYLEQTGVLPGIGFKRFSLRATLDQKIGSRVKIGLNTLNSLSYTDGDGINPMYTILTLSPLVSPYNDDGSVNIQPLGGANPHQDVGVRLNPLTLRNKEAIVDRGRRLRTYNTLYGELQILKGLKYRANVELDFRQELQGTYRGSNTVLTSASSTPFASNTASVDNGEAWTYAIDHQLIYDATFADKHKINVTALYGIQEDESNNSRFNGVGIPADYIQFYNLQQASQVTVPSGSTNNGYSRSGLLSYMGRLNYKYNGKYNLTATFRRDGSSRLAPGNKWFNYPALAAAWNASDEDFFQNVSFISNLKLRAGWGKSSNQSVAPYATLGSLSANNYNFGQTNVSGYFVSVLPNNTLTWESTEVTNLGLDFGFLKNRITGTIDVYKAETSDIIVGKQLPRSNGAATVFTNAAATESKGIEITLNTVNIENAGGFRWTTDINWSLNREKITALEEPGKTQDVGNGWFVGQPLNVIYDFQKIGIWQTKDDALRATYGAPQAIGKIRVADRNNDNKINADDQTIIGSAQPKWVAGMTNRVSYKNFDLSAVAFARWGTTLTATYLQSNNGGSGGYAFLMQARGNQWKVDYWTPNNPTNAFPHPEGVNLNDNYHSTLGYYDGTFVKIRSINLGYQLPSNLISKAGLSSARVYLTATNPFIVYSPFVRDGYGIDPEGTGTGTTLGPTGGGNATPTNGRAIIVGLNTPPTREFILGLNLKF